jgi:hypothetical protein
MHKRARSGKLFGIMVLCLFPISIPLILGILIYMAQRGKAQNAKYAKMTFDHSWVAAAWEKRRAANGSGAQSESDTKSEATSEGSGGSAVAGSTPATPRGRAPHASKANCTLLKPKSGTDVKHGNPGGVHRVAIRQSLEEARKPDLEDGGDVDVRIDDGEQVGCVAGRPMMPAHPWYSACRSSMFGQAWCKRRASSARCNCGWWVWPLHVGQPICLGYLPGAANRCLVVLQIDQLNALQWEKIHVDAPHYHAHAAIICRIPSRFKNADCLHYLIDKQLLFPNRASETI